MLAFFDLTVIVRFVTIAGLSYHACDLQQGFPAFLFYGQSNCKSTSEKFNIV